MARRIGVWVSGAALALTSSGGFANTQIIEGATFDVASVKPKGPARRGSASTQRPVGSWRLMHR
jgi:hypothetical protein